jgi:hypothetical protein
MGEDKWTSTLYDGRIAEFVYHQSNAAAWATRAIEGTEIVETHSPAPTGLSHAQVEALFVEH